MGKFKEVLESLMCASCDTIEGICPKFVSEFQYRAAVGSVAALFKTWEQAVQWCRKHVGQSVVIERGRYDLTGNGTRWVPDGSWGPRVVEMP